MPVAAPALLVKLWIAKKLAVLLAVRAVGVKRLYRRGLKASDWALGTEGAAATRARWVLRSTCSAAMKTEKFFAEKAFRYMDRVWAQAGFSSRGMPGVGATTPKAPSTSAPPRGEAPTSASAAAAREAAVAASAAKAKDA